MLLSCIYFLFLTSYHSFSWCFCIIQRMVSRSFFRERLFYETNDWGKERYYSHICCFHWYNFVCVCLCVLMCVYIFERIWIHSMKPMIEVKSDIILIMVIFVDKTLCVWERVCVCVWNTSNKLSLTLCPNLALSKCNYDRNSYVCFQLQERMLINKEW